MYRNAHAPSSKDTEFSIARLIQSRIAYARLSKVEFVSVLGYQNTNKGLRKLEEWLNDGAGDGEFLHKISITFGVSEQEISSALLQTIEELNKRQNK
jgi:hypothetical protein